MYPNLKHGQKIINLFEYLNEKRAMKKQQLKLLTSYWAGIVMIYCFYSKFLIRTSIDVRSLFAVLFIVIVSYACCISIRSFNVLQDHLYGYINKKNKFHNERLIQKKTHSEKVSGFAFRTAYILGIFITTTFVIGIY